MSATPLTDADVERLRAETPGCTQVLHLNHAGMSLMSAPVLDAVVAHLRREAAVGGYRAADEAGEVLAGVRAAVARLLGGHPDEVALVDSATRGWNLVVQALGLVAGDRVIVGSNEYGSNMIALLQLARHRGLQVDVAPTDEHGQVDVDGLDEMVDERVRLLALTHVATSSGTVQPAAAVGAVARRRGVPFLRDA